MALAALLYSEGAAWRQRQRNDDLAQAELVRRLDHFAFLGNDQNFGVDRIAHFLDEGFEYRLSLGCYSFPQLVSRLSDEAGRLSVQQANQLYQLYGLAKTADAFVGKDWPRPKRDQLRRAFADQFTASAAGGASFVDWQRYAIDFRDADFRLSSGRWYSREDCDGYKSPEAIAADL